MMTKGDQVLQIIDAFTEFCPEALFSFGHIVLDDYNLTDDNIKFCLKEETMEDWFNHQLSQAGFTIAGVDKLSVMRNIIEAFLRFLLAIPEDVRGDWLEDEEDAENMVD